MEKTNISDKRKKIIILVTTLILFIGVSFAFVAAQLSGGAIGNANVTADTTDNLQFNVDKDIYLNPTQFNVVEGGGGLSDTAVGTASLIANSTNNEASAIYNVYFKININEYIYTTEDSKPEIVLTITDPNGTPITSVDGFTYVTAENADGTTVSGFDITTVSGFDITTEMGLFTIATDYGITSASSINETEQDWTFTVTFINLTTNQTDNSGSTLDAEIILSREETNYHEVCEEGTFACNVARLYNEENPESNGLYYHNGGIVSETEYCMYLDTQVYTAYDMIPSTSATDCENVVYYGGFYYDNTLVENINRDELVTSFEQVSWDNENETCKTTSGEQVYGLDGFSGLFYELSQEFCSGYAQSNSDGTAMLFYSELGSGNMENVVTDAEDGSYRYSGANPNNYVCFGTSEETCPTDNLYRVIGIFDGQVKLIKYTNLGIYYWNSQSDNTCNENVKPALYYILNDSFYNDVNYIGDNWENFIDQGHKWQVGGFMCADLGNAKETYDVEIKNQFGYEEIMKIGLMYVSDYGYGASPEKWTTALSTFDYGIDNWLSRVEFLSESGLEASNWFLTRNSESNFYAFFMNPDGGVIVNGVSASNMIRPVFYLKSNVELAGGTGTQTDPYRLVV